MDEPDKHYFVKTDPAFCLVQKWVNDATRDHFTCTGYGECQSHYITGNNGNKEDTLETNPNICTWTRPYDFSRTAHHTMRSYMLKLFELDRMVDPEGSEPSNARNTNLYTKTPVDPKFARPANFGNKLAANAYEARWLITYYDMLFPHFYIENKISNIRPGDNRSINRQLVVIDYNNYVIWMITTTLNIRCIRVPPDEDYDFRAEPIVIYNRYDLVKGRVGRDVFHDYPFHRPDDNDRDDPIRELPEAMGCLKVE